MKKLKFVLLAIGSVSSTFAQKEIPMSTEKGTVTLLYDKLTSRGGGYVSLAGAVRNDTTFSLSYIMFEMVGYNSANVDIKACEPHRCAFSVYSLTEPLEPGQTAKLRSPGDSIFFKKNLSNDVARSEFRVLDLGYLIKYGVEAASATSTNFTIVPTFTLRGIGLDIRNTSGDVLELAWDQSVYIDEDGNSSRLIRANVNFAEKDRPQPNTVIPPGAKVHETVFPVDHITQQDGALQQVPLLPELARFFADPKYENELQPADYYRAGRKQLAGKELRLFLRLLDGDAKQNVTISFKITNMVQ